jgi:hypothetical protein
VESSLAVSVGQLQVGVLVRILIQIILFMIVVGFMTKSNFSIPEFLIGTGVFALGTVFERTVISKLYKEKG